jgi:hypothetical protein
MIDRFDFLLIMPCLQMPTARTCPPLMTIAKIERVLSLTGPGGDSVFAMRALRELT